MHHLVCFLILKSPCFAGRSSTREAASYFCRQNDPLVSWMFTKRFSLLKSIVSIRAIRLISPLKMVNRSDNIVVAYQHLNRQQTNSLSSVANQINCSMFAVSRHTQLDHVLVGLRSPDISNILLARYMRDAKTFFTCFNTTHWFTIFFNLDLLCG